MTLLMLVGSPSVFAGDWSEPKVVRRRAEAVVTYRAKLDGAILVVEAAHAQDWHTYALDNVERARAKTGKAQPETELPTRIEVTGGLKVAGNWHQSAPKDLSQEFIQWYTWGFEDVARFAVRVERVGGSQAAIVITGQACNASSCQMVEGVTLILPLSGVAEAIEENDLTVLDELIEVAPPNNVAEGDSD